MHLSSVQKLQIVLTAAKTTNDMPVVVEWIDISNIALPSFQTTPTNTNGVTIVDIVAAPAALIQRKISALTVTNRDTATKTVEIYLDNNGTDYLLVSCQLSVGDMLGYSDTRGWYAQDQYGCEKTTVQLAYSVVITALGFTPENVANKTTGVGLGTSDTLYPSQNAVKTYVDNIAGGTSLDFFLSNTVSDVATYYTLLNNPSPDAESNVATAITTNPTTVKTFATISTEPSITTLVSGVYTFHIHAAQTAGTKASTFYANLYTRTSGGAETLRATSESSATLSGVSTDYDLHFTVSSDISINATDRIIVEILGVPAGAGTDPTITIYMEGTTASRIEFRTTSAANDTRYLVKNGLSGGQTAIGGLDSGDDLLFKSTSHATKGYVGFGNLTTGFIYDETNNRIGLGVIPLNFMHWVMPASDNLYIDARTNPRELTLGVIRIDHTPNTPSTRPINIDVICAGHADTHAVNVDYHATGIAAGDDAHIYDTHVDTSTSTGGVIAALSVGKSGSGTVTVRAIEAYHGVEVIEQRTGTLTAIEQAWTYTGVYADVTTAFGSAATDVQIFAAVNDYVYIGMAGTFDDIEIILAIVASGAGIKPVFQYSAGASAWTTFTPVDGSNGLRNNGNISWTLPLAGWTTDTVNAVTKYWVRIQRTQNTLATPPTEDTIKVFSSTYYSWDSAGIITAKQLKNVNAVSGWTTTATAAGTTTLTVDSTYHQDFTGTTTQTVVLPDVTTLAVGHSYFLDNDSTGAVTVNSSGGNLVKVVPAGFFGIVTCILVTGTGAASWSARMPLPSNNATVTATAGDALTINNTGTGNCLVVEDSAKPDATPTVIDATGRIITGHTAALTLAGYTTRMQNHDVNGVMYARWSNDAGAETALHAKSRSATIGSFSIVTTGDVVADNLFAGDDGTAMVLAGYHRFQITGTPAVGNIQGKHMWATRNIAGALATRMELSSEGLLSVTGGIALSSGVLDLPNYTTGTRPTAATGNMIYDTTLNKACIGTGAGTWEVITSA